MEQPYRELVMKIGFAEQASPKTGAIVVGVEEGKKLTPSAQELEKETGGAIARAMKASKFTGKKGQSLQIAAPANVPVDRIVLVGLGKGMNDLDFQSLGGNLVPSIVVDQA